MDENQRVELEELVAQRLLDLVSQEDLENTYYDMQKEWTETLTDEQLLETAKDLNIQES
jgi:hypothetical protein